ncbi:hypothetical protein LINPERPRIM_LOCUS8929 [Linum perenne]
MIPTIYIARSQWLSLFGYISNMGRSMEHNIQLLSMQRYCPKLH